MRASAALTVEEVDGRSRCTELRSDPPLTLRDTATGVHLVASGAGPVGGDELGLRIRVGPGATLDLRSVAASMAHPGPSGQPSHLAIDVAVGAGGSLRWVPQPTILVQGCDHRVRTHVRLGAGATLVWREEVVLGRHGEPPGSLLQRVRVDGAGGPVLRNDLAIGPAWPGSSGPAGTGSGARAVGSLLVVGGSPAGLGDLPEHEGLRWAASPLGTPDAVLVSAVADTARTLTTALDELVGIRAARTASGTR